ncbi:MAG TPA: hypothetical protein PKG49_11475 [Nitrosomonas mobilis]|nr:hypothetical protein [Nitrosomonas mobilis]
MTRVIRLNNSSKQIVSFFLIFLTVSCQSIVEHAPLSNSSIHSLVMDKTAVFSSRNFDANKSIYVVSESGIRPPHLPLTSRLFGENGFFVTSEKDNADYIMFVISFITMPFKEDGRAMPYTAEYLLSMREEPPVVKPLLLPGESTKKQIDKMAKLVDKATNNGANFDMGANPISLGSSLGSGLGGIIAGAAMGVIGTATGIASQNNIKEGLAGLRFSIASNRSIGNQVVGFDIYIASTQPEHPETLLRAAIERAAIELGVSK